VKADSTTERAFLVCSWNRRDAILFSVVWKITASGENCGELLGDEVMKTASHHNCTLQVTLIEFEQLLQGSRKWESVFTLQSHFVDFSQEIINQSILCSAIQQSVKYEDTQHFVSRNPWTVGIAIHQLAIITYSQTFMTYFMLLYVFHYELRKS